MCAKMVPLSAVLIIISVVLVSGCVNQGTTATFGSGVTILNFEPEMEAVDSEESVNFQLRIKNLGSFEAKGSAKIDLSEWNCRGAAMASESFDNLIAPDPDRGTDGEEKVFLWNCQAPKITEGMHIPYEARVEVEYPYKTVSSKTITILPTSELVALRNAGKTLPAETLSQSHSPVSVDIVVKGPIRIKDSGGVEFPVTLRIANVGGGIIKDSKIVKLGVEGTGPISQVRDCDQTNLPLWKGQSQTITCEVTANNVRDLTQARIVVTADYTYIISTSARVTVTGA